ncbi:hypothetical protein V1511DRAFT_484696 [Dipodascopsis uninucleata]
MTNLNGKAKAIIAISAVATLLLLAATFFAASAATGRNVSIQIPGFSKGGSKDVPSDYSTEDHLTLVDVPDEKASAESNNATKPALDEALEYSSNPIRLLSTCSKSKEEKQRLKENGIAAANVLLSYDSSQRTIVRLDFGFVPQELEGINRFKPNLLPLASTYKDADYIVFARQSPKRLFYHHEIVYCDMAWATAQPSDRKILKCTSLGAYTLELPEWQSAEGVCKDIPFFAIAQGHIDPRVFLSPYGEPLMLVSVNGKNTCISQYIIDLRAVIPNLGRKLGISETEVPIAFSELTELTRDQAKKFEKNWVVLYDQDNVAYVQHELGPTRSLTILQGSGSGKNLLDKDKQETPQCIKELVPAENGSVDVEIHQATNSLRVTLCEFPCEPNVHNTVLVSIFHIKYKNMAETTYKRYAAVMNATAPFNIIARSPELTISGGDEKTNFYAVSMVWDRSFWDHPTWSEYLKKNKGDNTKYDPATSNDPIDKSTSNTDDYYHGWISDMVVINFSIDELESAVIHTPMKDILDCLIFCQ